jgi:hypothetical protein
VAPVRHLVALALGGVALAFGLTRADPPARPDPTPADPFGYRLPKGVHYVGNLSCASAACHAAAHTTGPGSEYTTWAGGDPHFKAYQVLTEPRSRQMVELLHGDRPGKPTPAHQEVRCLACHAPEAATAEPLAARGVGCESCHGPAERWLTAHYQDEFKSLSRREKAERYGLYPTKDLAFRVTLCASCHVGDAGREVDHDLIAAGHPRLAFEYTGYHHNPKYLRHWRETEYGPDFDARAWEIGRVACARSAAKLLASRAEKPDHAWPELAEYGCFACHKGLDARAGRPTLTTRKPGSMPWGTWYFAGLGLVTGDDPETRELARLMEGAPDRQAVARSANELVTRLDAKLADLQRAADNDSRSRPYDGPHLAGRFAAVADHALTPDGRRLRESDWDGVTQHYLGSAAYYYAWGAVDPQGRDARLRSPLSVLGGSLAFPKGYNSPTGLDRDGLPDLFRRLQPDRHP